MRYKDYDIDDFLMDEFFIQWIKNPNENNRHFWEKWLEQHPEKREVVMEAVKVISSIHYKNKPVMDDRLYIEAYENIIKAVKPESGKHPLRGRIKDWKFMFPFRQVAAALLVFLCVGIVYQAFFNPPVNEDTAINGITAVKRAN